MLRPLRVRWHEIEEVGLVSTRGREQLVVKSTRGTFSTGRQLLGSAPFAELVSLLRIRLGPKVRTSSWWAAFWELTRRELLFQSLYVIVVLALLKLLTSQLKV